MKISNCSCSCGNVRIRGQLIPQGVYPNIPPTERERLRFCKNLFSIQPQSIEIQQFGKVRARLLSSSCADMTCTSCSSTFRFFSSRGYSYFGKIQPSDNSQVSRQNNHKTFPPIKLAQKPIREQPPQSQNFNSNHEHDVNLSNTLPPLFTPLISRHRQKYSSQELQKRVSIEQNPSQVEHSPTTNTDLFNNIENLELDNGIDIDRNLNGSMQNEDEMLFTNNDDIDFELMFSNKADPVVGSYKQRMGIPFDGGLGNINHSEFQPKSYFA